MSDQKFAREFGGNFIYNQRTDFFYRINDAVKTLSPFNSKEVLAEWEMLQKIRQAKNISILDIFVCWNILADVFPERPYGVLVDLFETIVTEDALLLEDNYFETQDRVFCLSYFRGLRGSIQRGIYAWRMWSRYFSRVNAPLAETFRNEYAFLIGEIGGEDQIEKTQVLFSHVRGKNNRSFLRGLFALANPLSYAEKITTEMEFLLKKTPKDVSPWNLDIAWRYLANHSDTPRAEECKLLVSVYDGPKTMLEGYGGVDLAVQAWEAWIAYYETSSYRDVNSRLEILQKELLLLKEEARREEDKDEVRLFSLKDEPIKFYDRNL